MKRYTIGYVDHDAAVHARQLGPSLKGLSGDFNVDSTTSEKCPAINYNVMLDRCTTPYLILTHQDVTFSRDMLRCLDLTMDYVPDFGALGMVGVDDRRNYMWSNLLRIARLSTIDCCFIVIRKDSGIKFDSDTFDELHQYVEDYCGQVNSHATLGCYTILAKSAHVPAEAAYQPLGLEYINHHSFTMSHRGSCWGKWAEYRGKLEVKWPRIQTT